MERQEVVSRLVQSGAVGIIRVQENEDLVLIAHALQAGGLKCVEITMNSVGALHAIEKARRDLPDIIMGAGTVLDGATARHAILAGAEFIVTPTVEPDVIEMAHRYGVVIIPGAMSPTEILTAWELGVDMVKVFPADVLGPAYLKAIHGPLSQIPLAPTGGITANNAGEFIKAGAAIVSAGGWLVNKKAIIEGRYEEITKRAQELIQAVKEARGESGE